MIAAPAFALARSLSLEHGLLRIRRLGYRGSARVTPGAKEFIVRRRLLPGQGLLGNGSAGNFRKPAGNRFSVPLTQEINHGTGVIKWY